MADSFITQAAGLVDRSGRTLTISKPVHPLDDPEVWRQSAMYEPPGDVNIALEQKRIDDLMGTARNNESIYKLVWSGDMTRWNEVYTKWELGSGKGIGPTTRWPDIRQGAVRDENKRVLRWVFPPRWIIYSRLEPEQFADGWKQESWMPAPEIGGMKQIRPDEPPPVFWLWWMTIARHNDYCCGTKFPKKCFGEYAPPSFAYEMLGMQKEADAKAGLRRVYEKVDYTFAREVEESNNDYRNELSKLEIESETYLENPMALLGIHASLKAELAPKDADRIVKEFFDREKAATAKLV